jgi:glycolate oxidase iron-sulfur subunit
VIERELIDDCIHCGFCLPTCPTYGPLWREETDSPRGRIHLMAGLLDGTVPLTEATVEHFDRCLGCMACVTACPSGVRYDRLIEQTREYVEERYEREPADALLRSLVFAVFPYPRRLAAALRLAPLGRRLPVPKRLAPLVELAPRWRDREAPVELTLAQGERRARVGLLTGCVQSVLFGSVNAATARVLAAEGCDVLAPRSQRCCGALHLHAGRREEGLERAHRLARIFRDAGAEAIVVNAAGCGSHLKDAGLELPVKDVSELLAELPPRARRGSCASRSRTPATSRTRRRSGSSRARSSARSRASSWPSRPSRRSAAGAPASTTSSSRTPRASSGSARRATCSRPGPTSTRPPIPVASSR